MTADEIRKMRDDTVAGRIDGSLTEESASVFFMAEIAAQLAEMNQALLPVIAAGNRMATLIAAGNEMADHYEDLVKSLFAGTASEQPPSIKEWRQLTK